ncbi:hypothetical protein CSKR_200867 [Clonorchis sinensis]|uniref:Uncharacterized protein n=1 Tax=Clonorchis sinensis TaxID=79923 RepID=A0A8T1MJ50_CLOSI|nr:hypothetical protein CSKR_200867 [Clonorchis sinensis]
MSTFFSISLIPVNPCVHTTLPNCLPSVPLIFRNAVNGIKVTIDVYLFLCFFYGYYFPFFVDDDLDYYYDYHVALYRTLKSSTFAVQQLLLSSSSSSSLPRLQHHYCCHYFSCFRCVI